MPTPKKRSLENAGVNNLDASIDSMLIDKQLEDAYYQAKNNWKYEADHERDVEVAENLRLGKKWGIPLGYLTIFANAAKNIYKDQTNNNTPKNKAMREVQKAKAALDNFRNKR